MFRNAYNQAAFVALSLLSSAELFSQPSDIYSRPVGSLEIPLLAETDSIISIPFFDYCELAQEINAVSADQWILGNGVVTPNMAADQFAISHFAQLATGPLNGRIYEITTNDDSSITIDPAGEVLDDQELIGQRVKIYPFWTIERLFGSLKTFNPSSSLGGIGAKLELLFYNIEPGRNLVPSIIYFYYEGSGPGGSGWRRKGGSLTTTVGDDRVDHQSMMIIRNRSTDDHALVISGEVSTSNYVTQLLKLNTDSPQDNLVGLNSPVPVTLAESGLFESGAFKPSTSLGGIGGDDLYLFDTSETGLNKSSSLNFFYYNGSAPGFGGPGWRLIGSSLTEVQDNYEAFKPGVGFVIRKQHDGTISEDTWIYSPPYAGQ